jgi:hypothetical protein
MAKSISVKCGAWLKLHERCLELKNDADGFAEVKGAALLCTKALPGAIQPSVAATVALCNLAMPAASSKAQFPIGLCFILLSSQWLAKPNFS